MTKPTAVIVEDEPQIRRIVRDVLQEEGWVVHEADTLQRGLQECGSRKPDLVVLDLGLPDGDGGILIRELRGWSQIPILVLSARCDESDKVAALDAGADDYLTKPFGNGELLARIRANLRRPRALSVDQAISRFGEVEVDQVARVVRRSGAEVHLTPIEYRLLVTLAAQPGRVLTHRTLLREVWGPAHSDQTHYLRIQMGNLRRKLEVDPAQPKHLQTEVGVGYRLVL